MELLKKTLEKIDIVVCTALIPGKKAPIIITKDMIDVMQSGSIIYDLAAAQGGNAEPTKVDEIVNYNGVTIVGEKNIYNKLETKSGEKEESEEIEVIEETKTKPKKKTVKKTAKKKQAVKKKS